MSDLAQAGAVVCFVFILMGACDEAVRRWLDRRRARRGHR